MLNALYRVFLYVCYYLYNDEGKLTCIYDQSNKFCFDDLIDAVTHQYDFSTRGLHLSILYKPDEWAERDSFDKYI